MLNFNEYQTLKINLSLSPNWIMVSSVNNKQLLIALEIKWFQLKFLGRLNKLCYYCSDLFLNGFALYINGCNHFLFIYAKDGWYQWLI